MEHGVPDDVALEAGLLGAAAPDLDHGRHARGRLPGGLQARIGTVDVRLLSLEIRVFGHVLLRCDAPRGRVHGRKGMEHPTGARATHGTRWVGASSGVPLMAPGRRPCQHEGHGLHRSGPRRRRCGRRGLPRRRAGRVGRRHRLGSAHRRPDRRDLGRGQHGGVAARRPLRPRPLRHRHGPAALPGRGGVGGPSARVASACRATTACVHPGATCPRRRGWWPRPSCGPDPPATGWPWPGCCPPGAPRRRSSASASGPSTPTGGRSNPPGSWPTGPGTGDGSCSAATTSTSPTWPPPSRPPRPFRAGSPRSRCHPAATWTEPSSPPATPVWWRVSVSTSCSSAHPCPPRTDDRRPMLRRTARSGLGPAPGSRRCCEPRWRRSRPRARPWWCSSPPRRTPR